MAARKVYKLRCISFAACQYLRHARGRIHLRSDGSYSIRRLSDLPILRIQRCSAGELREFIRAEELDENGKRRVEELEPDGGETPRARACQGHNARAAQMIDRWRMMEEIWPGHDLWPASGIAAHGTFRQHVAGILQHGLQAGGVGGRRADNHLVAQVNAVGSDQPGLRGDSDAIVFVTMEPHYMAGKQVLHEPPARHIDVADHRTGAYQRNR